MTKRSLLCVMVLVIGLGVTLSVAGKGEEVTLEGKVVCAKCALKEEGRDKCQNVLVVESDEQTRQYYLTGNETNTELGYVCMESRAVRVTGTVTEDDGRLWLSAKEIIGVESES